VTWILSLPIDVPLPEGIFLNAASFRLNTLEFPSSSESSKSGEDVRGRLRRAAIQKAHIRVKLSDTTCDSYLQLDNLFTPSEPGEGLDVEDPFLFAS
jgi:hypothetical protein